MNQDRLLTYEEGVEDGKKAEREEWVKFLREHWLDYDTAEAPKWVYLGFGGTQEDWENRIGKP